MTVPATPRRAGPYTGDGVQVAFAFSFKAYATTDVQVRRSTVAGVESIVTSGITITLNADQVATPGGTVAFSTAPAAGEKVAIVGGTPYDQTLALPLAGNYNPVSLERNLDRQGFQIQRLAEAVARALSLPATGSAASAELPAPVGNRYLGWNSAGTALVNREGTGAANAADITFQPEGTGATPRDSQSKMRDSISVKDFGALGDGTNNDQPWIQAALNAGATLGRAVYVPGTTSFYRITDELVVPDGVAVYGDGFASCIKQVTREKNVFSMGSRTELRGLRIQGDGVTTGGVAFAKNNGVSVVTKQNVKILSCWIHACEFNGVYAQNTSGLTIQGNVFYGNAYSSTSGSDVVLFSDIGSIRTNIAGNFFLSNNSQACYVNALGKDTDIVITNNFSCPVDAAGVVVTGTSILRRHSFMLGYVGGTDAGGRIICSNNISMNTRQTGVYWQSSAATQGSVTISHNYVRNAGTNAIEPALVGGIYIAAQGLSDIVIGNIVETIPQTGFVTAAGINVLPANVGVGVGNSTTIIGNTIIDTSGHGVRVGAAAQNVSVRNNTVNGHTQAAYCYVPGAGFTGGGTIEFIGNRSYRPTGVIPAMYTSRDTATPYMTISGNTFVGFNNTTASADNCGILHRNWDQAWRYEGNTIIGFYAGVSSDTYCNNSSGGPRFINNIFNNCNAAYHIGTSAAGKLITQGDQLNNTPTYQSPALLAGNRVAWPGLFTVGAGVQVFNNAAPTVGTWAVGDRVQQTSPAVGQPKGWSCTVAGAPGTWVSEGNL